MRVYISKKSLLSVLSGPCDTSEIVRMKNSSIDVFVALLVTLSLLPLLHERFYAYIVIVLSVSQSSISKFQGGRLVFFPLYIALSSKPLQLQKQPNLQLTTKMMPKTCNCIRQTQPPGKKTTQDLRPAREQATRTKEHAVTDLDFSLWCV